MSGTEFISSRILKARLLYSAGGQGSSCNSQCLRIAYKIELYTDILGKAKHIWSTDVQLSARGLHATREDILPFHRTCVNASLIFEMLNHKY